MSFLAPSSMNPGVGKVDEKMCDGHRKMQTRTDYLPMDALHAGMAYGIWARNAYVGIWLPAEQGFLISRYKMGAIPRLSIEQHWDVGEPLGTAKPLHALEVCQIDLPECFQTLADREEQAICAWLDALETQYPLFPRVDTVAMRRDAALQWQQRQTEARRNSSSRPRVWTLESR